MLKKINPLKLLITSVGCLVIINVPIFGILALWDFKPGLIEENLKEIFGHARENNSNNYNFQIHAAEDNLLTSSVIETGKQSEIIPDVIPAKTLIVNSVQIQGPIVYGHEGQELLKQGFWHHPASVYPGEQGISVIFGHRRHHLPPATDTFYNLDKIQKQDRIEIELENGVWLEYVVTDIEIIEPDSLQSIINEETDDYLLRLITCTPLGTDKQRLIITAKKAF